jgi:hypothetical protein
MPVLVLPYKSGSQSAKLLAEALGYKRVLLRNQNAQRHAGKTILNWGNSTYPLIPNANYINPPEQIANATNKLSAFRIMENSAIDVRIPDWTTDINVAHDWKENGHAVVERHKLQGHSADGLRLVGINDELQRAPLYTKYVKKTDEYRVHVMNGTAFHVQRKARRMDVPDDQVNWQVRNHDNGFIYQINLDKPVPQDVITQAKNAISALGLDFGAVDVIFNNHHNQATVLEVNTACGLEGTTLEKYIQAFRADNVPEFANPVGNRVREDDPDPEPVREEPQEARDEDEFIQEVQHPVFNNPEPQNVVQEEIDFNSFSKFIESLEDKENISPEELELLRKSIVKLNTWFINLED